MRKNTASIWNPPAYLDILDIPSKRWGFRHLILPINLDIAARLTQRSHERAFFELCVYVARDQPR